MAIKIGRVVFLLYIIIRLIFLIIDWSKTTYEINDGMIQIKRGVFQRKQNSIPLQEIQNITWSTPFYYQWFNITSLHLETSSTNESASVQLDAVKMNLAEQIEQLTTTYKTENENNIDDIDEMETEVNKLSKSDIKDNHRNVHFSPTRKEVLKASFLSFSFLGLIPIIAIGYRELDKIVNLDQQAKGLFTFLTSSWIFIVGAIFLLIILAVAFGIIQTYLKYGKYEISSDEERIFIYSGVLNEKVFSIQKANVQAIRIKQSPLKKLLHFSEIKLISAGSNEGETDDIRSLYPFLPTEKAKGLLVEILPQFPLTNAENKLPPKALYMRLLRLPWFWIIATAFIFLFKEEWWFLSPILFVTTYLSRYFTYRNTRFSWNDKSIQFRTGGLSTDIFITNRKKVIEVNVEQNIIQKKFGIATINTVNRVKPVHHGKLQDVPFSKSEQFIKWYKQRATEVRTE
ncbi:MAG TPA: PH domain-containing protein [Candidatus Avamphibacillus sp.]|nr:PH domain-containing protein [Candidatus Avamphibacillus sp.]